MLVHPDENPITDTRDSILRDMAPAFNFLQIILDIEGMHSPYVPTYDIRTPRCLFVSPYEVRKQTNLALDVQYDTLTQPLHQVRGTQTNDEHAARQHHVPAVQLARQALLRLLPTT